MSDPVNRPLSIWGVLASKKHWIITAGVVGAVVAAASSYLVTPTFRAEVLVMPVTEERNALGAFAGQFAALAELSGLNVGGSGSKAAAVATLKSRSLTDEFLTERNLFPVLFADKWDSATGRWKGGDAPTTWDAYRLFDHSVRKLSEDRKTGLVILAIEWRDPVAAADWANELVTRTNKKLQQERIVEGQKTIKYLSQQLERANVLEVRQALYSIIEAETKSIAVAHAREQFSFKVIDPAVPAGKPIRPNRISLTLLGFISGLFISAFIFTAIASRQI